MVISYWKERLNYFTTAVCDNLVLSVSQFGHISQKYIFPSSQTLFFYIMHSVTFSGLLFLSFIPYG